MHQVLYYSAPYPCTVSNSLLLWWCACFDYHRSFFSTLEAALLWYVNRKHNINTESQSTRAHERHRVIWQALARTLSDVTPLCLLASTHKHTHPLSVVLFLFSLLFSLVCAREFACLLSLSSPLRSLYFSSAYCVSISLSLCFELTFSSLIFSLARACLLILSPPNPTLPHPPPLALAYM